MVSGKVISVILCLSDGDERRKSEGLVYMQGELSIWSLVTCKKVFYYQTVCPSLTSILWLVFTHLDHFNVYLDVTVNRENQLSESLAPGEGLIAAQQNIRDTRDGPVLATGILNIRHPSNQLYAYKLSREDYSSLGYELIKEGYSLWDLVLFTKREQVYCLRNFTKERSKKNTVKRIAVVVDRQVRLRHLRGVSLFYQELLVHPKGGVTNFYIRLNIAN